MVCDLGRRARRLQMAARIAADPDVTPCRRNGQLFSPLELPRVDNFSSILILICEAAALWLAVNSRLFVSGVV